MREFFVVVLTCLLCFSSANASLEVAEEVKAGFFVGRSGLAILYKQDQIKNDDSLIAFVTPSLLQSSGPPAELSLYDVAPTVSHIFGLASSVSSASSSSASSSSSVSSSNEAAKPSDFLSINPFSRPFANLLLTVDGIGKDELSQFGLSNLGNTFSHSGSALTNIPYPHNTMASTLSLITGVAPSTHGIVGKSWHDAAMNSVNAFSELSSHSQVASLSDFFSQSFGGKSLTLSFSGAYLQAVASCAHQEIRKAHPQWNNFCLSYDYSKGEVTSIDRNSKFHLTEQQLEEAFSSSSLWSQLKQQSNAIQNVEYESVSRILTVSFITQGTVQIAQFNLNLPDVRAFFSEIVFMSQLPSILKLQYSTLVNDQSPDFYALTISGLNGIVSKYSSGSTEHIAAMLLVDGSVTSLLKDFSSLYSDRLLSQIVLFSPNKVDTAVTSQMIDDLQKSFNWKNIRIQTQHFPSIYASISRLQLESFCDTLSNQVKTHGYSIHCAGPNSGSFMELGSRFRLMDSTADSTTMPPELFQIFMWLSIALALIVYAAVYSIAYMDSKKDTLLYSKFNPQSRKP